MPLWMVPVAIISALSPLVFATYSVAKKSTSVDAATAFNINVTCTAGKWFVYIKPKTTNQYLAYCKASKNAQYFETDSASTPANQKRVPTTYVANNSFWQGKKAGFCGPTFDAAQSEFNTAATKGVHILLPPCNLMGPAGGQGSFIYQSPAQMITALDKAQAAGVKLTYWDNHLDMMYNPNVNGMSIADKNALILNVLDSLENNITGRSILSHPAFAGIHLTDEPTYDAFKNDPTTGSTMGIFQKAIRLKSNQLMNLPANDPKKRTTPFTGMAALFGSIGSLDTTARIANYGTNCHVGEANPNCSYDDYVWNYLYNVTPDWILFDDYFDTSRFYQALTPINQIPNYVISDIRQFRRWMTDTNIAASYGTAGITLPAPIGSYERANMSFGADPVAGVAEMSAIDAANNVYGASTSFFTWRMPPGSPDIASYQASIGGSGTNWTGTAYFGNTASIPYNRPAPSIDFTSSSPTNTVPSGSNATISWISRYAIGCTVSAPAPVFTDYPGQTSLAFSNVISLNGSVRVGPMSATTTFTISCWNGDPGHPPVQMNTSKTLTLTVQ